MGRAKLFAVALAKDFERAETVQRTRGSGVKDFDAIEITEHTLIGAREERPDDRGNCFSVKSADSKYYRIVNFNLENLEALIELGLTWPLKCCAIDERRAIVHDPRIGERWYQTRYCEVCTPTDLLQPFQIHQHERQVMRGQRTESESEIDGKKLTIVCISFSDEYQPQYR